MKKRCYIYTRVSTAAQIEGYSLYGQDGMMVNSVDGSPEPLVTPKQWDDLKSVSD